MAIKSNSGILKVVFEWDVCFGSNAL